MKIISKTSPFALFFLLEHVRASIIAYFLIITISSGIGIILLEVLMRVGKYSEVIRVVSEYGCMLAGGLYYFIGGMLPILFKKTRPFYFYKPDKYQECITGLLIISAVGFGAIMCSTAIICHILTI